MKEASSSIGYENLEQVLLEPTNENLQKYFLELKKGPNKIDEIQKEIKQLNEQDWSALVSQKHLQKLLDHVTGISFDRFKLLNILITSQPKNKNVFQVLIHFLNPNSHESHSVVSQVLDTVLLDSFVQSFSQEINNHQKLIEEISSLKNDMKEFSKENKKTYDLFPHEIYGKVSWLPWMLKKHWLTYLDAHSKEINFAVENKKRMTLIYEKIIQNFSHSL